MQVGKIDELRGIWRGQTVACIASGPSLTAEDCEMVRGAGLPTIVVNTSFRMAPWADILYAMDAGWWREYGPEVDQVFSGKRFSYVRIPGAIPTKGKIYPTGWGNSGSFAISLAVISGAAKVLMLGYDCKVSNDGRKHWHADHPKSLGNANSIKRWPYQFELVARYAKEHKVRALNCSRATALTCFERSSLEEQCFARASIEEQLAEIIEVEAA